MAGAVVIVLSYAVQERPSGPPVPVTFLPAFWLLVPGALGLEGVTQIVAADAAAGLGQFLSALLTIVVTDAAAGTAGGLVGRTGMPRASGRSATCCGARTARTGAGRPPSAGMMAPNAR